MVANATPVPLDPKLYQSEWHNPECIDTPFYHRVPKDLRENRLFRRRVLSLAKQDKEYARELWIMCSRDPLFFLNTFAFTYDPRKPQPVMPFVSYAYQDDAIMDIVRAIETGDDRVIEKSRDMGASWIILYVFLWFWLFRPHQSFLCVSRKEEYVDKAGDYKSLMGKIDLALKYLPKWMQPETVRTKLHLFNCDNGSVIDGESTTGDVARGDRRRAILIDEFAAFDSEKPGTGRKVLSATRDATKCRLFNSTPKGIANAFYELVILPTIMKIRMHWSVHPEKAAGLYKDDDGKLRSPWYDNECKRAVHPMEIAQELDIDYLGSDYSFFPPATIDAYLAEHCHQAIEMGELDYDRETLKVHGIIQGRGKLRVWVPLSDDGKIIRPSRQFVVSCDIATGTGASNSVLSAADRQTGEKILEYADPNISPERFAKLAVAVCRWLGDPSGDGAFLIWEANGPGRTFGNMVLELGYRNIYYRRDENRLNQKQSDFPGWYSTSDTKPNLLADYRRGLSENTFFNPSKEAIEECRDYIYAANGTIQHAKAYKNDDPSGAKDNHGDRVIADALLCKGLKVMPAVEYSEQVETYPVNSMGYRIQQRLKNQDGAEEDYESVIWN